MNATNMTLTAIADSLTLDQIRALQAEAGAAGDTETVATCRRAADGSDRALRAVARHIRDAARRAAAND